MRAGFSRAGTILNRLVSGLHARHADLAIPIRMIPAGEVLVRLDEMIREGHLPGIEAFFERNQEYFIRSRGPKAPFNPPSFQRQAGVLNFYATLIGQSPIGLAVEPDEMFDSEACTALIKTLQQTVWEAVSLHPHTGLKDQD